MAKYLPNVKDTDATIRAIEENTAEFLLAMGRAGGGEERNDQHVQWVIGGSPIAYHNCVVRADLPPGLVNETIAASIERFKAHGVPGSWHVGPSMRPANIGEGLLAHGFSYDSEPGMAADLLALNEELAAPGGVTIERVRDEQALDAWAYTLSLGFGEGEKEADWVREVYRAIGLGDEVPWRHYLARLDREPAATSSMFLGAEVAGIYFVSTAPRARRRGLGSAITLAPLFDARALGYRVAVLGASSMGYSVYRRLGFEEYCTIGVYEREA